MPRSRPAWRNREGTSTSLIDEELAFIYKFLSNPGDLTPLLVLADWWERRGDRRSELARAYCEKSAPGICDERLDELESMMWELCKQHAADWFFRPYQRLSNEHLFAYVLEPSGLKTPIGNPFTTSDLRLRVGDRLEYNYMLTDTDFIFWNPLEQGEMNVPAMALIRDAENVHHDAMILPWDFLEEIRGSAIIVDGGDNLDGFNH